MGMPSISITFSELAKTLPERGETGIVGLILKGAVPAGNPVEVMSEEDIPASLAAANKEAIALALKGNDAAPQKVIVYCLPAAAENYNEALGYFELSKVTYLAIPGIEENETSAIVEWVKAVRKDGKSIKAVLPNTAADSEAIINFATDGLVAGETSYTTAQYCARVAGVLAGTSLDRSCTYAPLPELTACKKMTRSEMDAEIDAGKLVLFNDGEKVKIARGVNSLTTISDTKGNQFKKIKIVELMDKMRSDITRNIEDNYIGKHINTYDNKCLLVSGIDEYLNTLLKSKYISEKLVEIDIQANKDYLKDAGVDIAAMSDEEIKKTTTGDKVFLKIVTKILDAIEEVTIPIVV